MMTNPTSAPDATPTTLPHPNAGPLLKVDRRVLAHMGAVKEVCILLATASFYEHERYIGLTILLIRGVLSYYERTSMVANPLTEPGK